LSLRVNFGWTLAGTVLYAACQWAMLSVLAKLTSPEEVGHFALGLAVARPIFILSDLPLRAIQATHARATVRFSDYLAVIIAWTAVLVLQDLPGRAMDRSRAPDLRTRNERARDRRRVVMTGLPLGIVLLLVSLNFNIPRYFLQASRGERELGIFAALASTV